VTTQDYFERATKNVEIMDKLKKVRYMMASLNHKLEHTSDAPFVKAVFDLRKSEGRYFLDELLLLQAYVGVWLDVLDPDGSRRRSWAKSHPSFIAAKRREARLSDDSEVIEADVAYSLVVRHGGDAR